MNGNPFGDSIYSNLTGSNNQNNRQNTQNIHRNPFDEDDEVATVRFQPPPRPPKQANKSNSIGAGSQGVKSLRVFGGPTSPASPSVFSRATSIGGTPGASVFNSGGNRYSVVTTNSTSRSDKSTHNPFATDEDIENAEKSEIESHSRSPLYLSIDNRSTRSIGAQRSGYFPGSLIGNERYGDSEEVAACDDGGIELRITETGSSAGLTPPKKPIKQPKVSKNDEKTKEGARDSQTISGTLVASTPTSPSKKPKKIRKKIVAVDQLDENAVVRHLLSELGTEILLFNDPLYGVSYCIFKVFCNILTLALSNALPLLFFHQYMDTHTHTEAAAPTFCITCCTTTRCSAYTSPTGCTPSPVATAVSCFCVRCRSPSVSHLSC